MHLISANIYQFIQEALRGEHKIDSTLLDVFAEQAKGAVKRQLERGGKSYFSTYLSNIGKPLCVLQMEREHGRQSSPNVIRNIFGDMVEALVVLLIGCSGIKIVSEQGRTTLLTLAGDAINGRFDLVLELNGEESVWDIKSASDYAFRKYLREGFAGLAKSDPFGYKSQLFGYSMALGVPAGGWVIVNKSSGDIFIMDIPKGTHEEYQSQALALIESNMKALKDNQPFRRLFEDEPETFRKKPTGNRVLGNACEMCEFNKLCWPTLQVRPSVVSTGKNPPLIHYTHLEE